MQIGMFDGTKPLKIDKPIRLIELFAGIGSQAKALKRLGTHFEHWVVCEYDKYAITSYNAIHGTNFETSDITKLKGIDLKIIDIDKYTYIMTYSFPCQDLSKAGKGKGMAKDSGTRSGLLWEVERLLNETENLPQILLMENVPDVIGTKNIKHFAKWVEFLEKDLGYKCWWKCLNAKNYGIPQNRDRCFMVSVLGDYYYEFPKPIKLELRLKDMLENNVDEKYYISNAQLEKIVNSTFNTNKTRIQSGGGLSDTVRERLQRPDLCRTIRNGGGRGSLDKKHNWDIVIEPSGLYTNQSPDFQKPPLNGISRCLKANQHDAGVVIGRNKTD